MFTGTSFMISTTLFTYTTCQCVVLHMWVRDCFIHVWVRDSFIHVRIIFNRLPLLCSRRRLVSSWLLHEWVRDSFIREMATLSFTYAWWLPPLCWRTINVSSWLLHTWVRDLFTYEFMTPSRVSLWPFHKRVYDSFIHMRWLFVPPLCWGVTNSYVKESRTHL